jgi:hypothetical protein
MNMPNNEQEAWAEILKARDAVLRLAHVHDQHPVEQRL